MKVIDLLNKIANGETPKIKLGDEEYFYKHGDYRRTSDGEWLFANEIINLEGLNDEVEILDEEDEFIDIESFDGHYSWDNIDYKNIEELKKYVTKDFQNIFNTLDKLNKNQKKIIQALKENK
jgi:ribosomal protein S18